MPWTPPNRASAAYPFGRLSPTGWNNHADCIEELQNEVDHLTVIPSVAFSWKAFAAALSVAPGNLGIVYLDMAPFLSSADLANGTQVIFNGFSMSISTLAWDMDYGGVTFTHPSGEDFVLGDWLELRIPCVA